MTDDELRQLIESNARAVQANSESIGRLERTVEANAEQSRQTDARLDQLARLVIANRQGIDEANQQLRDSISDTVAMIGTLAEQHQANEDLFRNLLEDARVDRQRNDAEHRAFQQTIQTLLTEIARIWQRLAG